MEQTPEIIQRYLEDGTIIHLGLSQLSMPAKTAAAAVVIFSGAGRQSLVDRAARVLRVEPAAIIRGLYEAEKAGVIRQRVPGKPAIGYELCEPGEWRTL